ncbi:LysM peptidoglycan-binding domain-containing M23 family metallopeptidase [Fodinicurvata sp. EGI_FJ10296]|uniref:LysM peptidoglycan-binding domain-containing M23 family metallopeptidase n=1 Tax=Fodinicurvata sp. EGI_FJ10296 TaxID=3231908 RepID=UPI00345634A2
MAVSLLVSALAAGCTLPPPLPGQSGDVTAEEQSPRYAVVQPGENVSIVAERTGIPVRAIIAENDLREPYTVYPGQQLSLPQAQFHHVSNGDTLYRIAQNYDVDVDAVAQANRLDTPYTIFVGQSLRIPEGPGQGRQTSVGQTTVAERGDAGQDGGATTAWSEPRQDQDAGRAADGRPRALTPARSSNDRTVTAEPLSESPSGTSQTREAQADNDDQTDGSAVPPDSARSVSPPSGTDGSVPAEADITAQPVADESSDEGQEAEAPRPEPQDQPTQESAAVNEEQANLPAVSAPAARSGDRFSWPIDGSVISTFGPKDDGQHNDGINIDAPRGTPIRAADNGVVAYAGSELRGYGNLIIVRHADGWVTAYGHADTISVQRGQSVSVGDTLGEVGSTGAVSSPQLHFEIRRQSTPVDPMDHLTPRG